MDNEKAVNLCEGPLLGKMVSFSIPIILSGVLQLLFNAVDMIVVGRFCGSDSLAAVGATGSMSGLIISLFLGLSIGASVSISHAVGAKSKKEIDRVLHTSVLASIIAGLVLAVIGISVARPLLQLMNTPAEIIDKSTLYIRIIYTAMPINLFFHFCAAMLRSTGDSARPLIYLIIGGIANVFLNIILVTVVKLDVAGVAIATVFSQLISAILALHRLIKGTEHLRLKRKKLHISMPHLIKIMKIGIPAGISTMAFSFANVIVQASINIFGATAVAANSATASIEGFIFAVTGCFSQTSVTFVGQNMGARKYDRVKRATALSAICGAVAGLAMSVTVLIFGNFLLSIYCPDNPDAIAMGILRIKIMAGGYLLDGMIHATTGALRGMGYSLSTTIIAILGQLGLRLAWIMTIFARYKTLEVIYFSFPVSHLFILVVNIAILVILFRKLKHKKEALPKVTQTI